MTNSKLETPNESSTDDSGIREIFSLVVTAGPTGGKVVTRTLHYPGGGHSTIISSLDSDVSYTELCRTLGGIMLANWENV